MENPVYMVAEITVDVPELWYCLSIASSLEWRQTYFPEIKDPRSHCEPPGMAQVDWVAKFSPDGSFYFELHSPQGYRNSFRLSHHQWSRRFIYLTNSEYGVGTLNAFVSTKLDLVMWTSGSEYGLENTEIKKNGHLIYPNNLPCNNQYRFRFPTNVMFWHAELIFLRNIKIALLCPRLESLELFLLPIDFEAKNGGCNLWKLLAEKKFYFLFATFHGGAGHGKPISALTAAIVINPMTGGEGLESRSFTDLFITGWKKWEGKNNQNPTSKVWADSSLPGGKN